MAEEALERGVGLVDGAEDLHLEATREPEAASVGERHLTFELDGQVYGVPLARVREIVRVQKTTPVPGMPEHVLGVMNLRGTIVPVVDVRRRLGMVPRPPDERTCVVVCAFRYEGIGLIVDTVCDVVAIEPEAIVEARPAEADAEDELLRGLVHLDDGVKLLIWLDRMLGGTRDARTVDTA